jgi:hypothetical protein
MQAGLVWRLKAGFLRDTWPPTDTSAFYRGGLLSASASRPGASLGILWRHATSSLCREPDGTRPLDGRQLALVL